MNKVKKISVSCLLSFCFSLISTSLFSQACPSSTTPDCNLVCFGNFEMSDDNFKDAIDFLPAQGTWEENSADLCINGNTQAIKFTAGLNKEVFGGLEWAIFNCTNGNTYNVTGSGKFANIANGPDGYWEGICLPLKRVLKLGKKYRLSFKWKSGCSNSFSLHLSNTRPCNQNSGVFMNFRNQTFSVSSCNYISQQVINFSLTGNPNSASSPWNIFSQDFTANANSEFITLVSKFTGATENTYFDDIEIIEYSEKLDIKPSIVSSCIGGKLVIDYKICYPARFPNQTITLTPNTPLPTGLSFSNQGDFPLGFSSVFTLPSNNDTCITKRLILDVDSNVPDLYNIDLLMNVKVESCDRQIPEFFNVSFDHTFHRPNPDFTSKNNFPCNGILLNSLDADSKLTHNWEIRNNNVLLYSSANPIYSQQLAPGNYDVTHTVYLDGCPFSITKNVTLDPCPDFYCTCFNPKFNIGKPNTTYSISTTGLMNVAHKLSDVNCISITGTMIIDEDFTFDNCNITMEPFAQIIINPERKLFIENSFVHGCNELWGFIESKPYSTIRIFNSTVRDAQAAVILNNYSNYDIVLNNFTNNYRCIYTRNNTPNFQYPKPYLGSVLRGNTFTGGDKTLMSILPPFIGRAPYSGIEITKTYFNIGDAFSANNFDNLEFGIRANESAVFVNNAYLNDITNSAIATNFKGTSTTQPTKAFTRLSVYNSTVSNSFNGIVSDQTSMFVNNLTTSSTMFGIRTEFPTDLQIQNSSISYFEDGVFVGGNMQALSGRTFIKTTGLQRLSGNMTPGGNLSVGLILQSFDARSFNNFFINDIQIDAYIQNAVDPIPNNALAMWIGNVKGLNLKSNRINLSACGAATPPNCLPANRPVDGVQIVTSDDIRMKDNNLNASTSGQVLNLDETTNANFCCNEFNIGNFGIKMHGTLMNFKLRHNYFNWHHKHINPSLTTEMTIQTNAKNNFNVHGVNLGGRWGYDPTTSNYTPYQLYINLSKIRIEEPYVTPNQTLWANIKIKPVLLNPGVVVQNNPDWFERKVSTNSNLNCNNDLDCDDNLFRGLDDIPSFNDSMSARGYLKTAAFGNMAAWRSARTLYSRIGEHPLLRQNSLMDSFFVANTNTSIGRLYEVERKIKEMVALTSLELQSSTNFNNQIETAHQDLMDIYAQMRATNNTDTLNALKNSEETKMTLLKAAIDEMNVLFQSIQARQAAALAQIKIDNQAVLTEAVWDKNEKDLNTVLCHTVLANTLTLNTEQQTIVTQIANQCVNYGGRAVSIARNLLFLINKQRLDNYHNCVEGDLGGEYIPITDEERIANVNQYKDVIFTIAPNPANNEVTIMSNQIGHLFKIIDIMGRVVYEQQLIDSNTLINTSHLQDGFYECQIVSDKHLIKAQKLIISH